MKDLLEFHIEIDGLKRTIRYESCKYPVRESTSDHSWHLALFCIDVIEKFNLDINKLYAIKLALTHDICEYQGEFDKDSYMVSKGKITKEEKKEFEKKAVENLKNNYNRPDLYDLWVDYTQGNSKEAKFIKAMDKLEALIHIISVGGSTREGHQDGDFMAHYADKEVLEFEELKPLLKEVKIKLKEMFLSQGYVWKPEYDLVS